MARHRPERRLTRMDTPRAGPVFAAMAFMFSATQSHAADPAPAGFYAAPQAQQGRALYGANCSGCHGASLQGGAGPALVGPNFSATWGTRTLGNLVDFEHSQMPPGKPGSISMPDDLAITAFILQSNHAPAGTTALAPGSPLLGRQVADALRAPGATPAGAPAAAPPPAAPVLTASSRLPEQAALDRADQDPRDWLMYNKGYRGERYSALEQISAANASRLTPVCAYQLGTVGPFQASPVIHDGVLYITTSTTTHAIDAATCRRTWMHTWAPTGPDTTSVNRGIAVGSGRVVRGTQDGFVFALDAKTGKVLWSRQAGDPKLAQFFAAPPIIWRDLVIIGRAGGDWGAVGKVMAFRLDSGAPVWTFDTVPTGTQKGADTWKRPQSTATGGSAIWTVAALDPETGLVYLPVGNPGPDFAGDYRPGDNLFSDCVLVLDAATGALEGWYQLNPHDIHDWDTTGVMLFDRSDGRKLIGAVGKEGVLHVLDRETRTLLYKVVLSPRENADALPTPQGIHVCPGTHGGLLWNGPAYSPKSGLIYLNTSDWCVTLVSGDGQVRYVAGELFSGLKNGLGTFDAVEKAKSLILAIDPHTGEIVWRQERDGPGIAAVTATAGGVVFTGDQNGAFLALDGKTGRVLYEFMTGGAVGGGIATYEVKGAQYVAVASGNGSRVNWPVTGSATVLVFGLPR
jgi:alcohol dehydrogenase (cytochrome c)